MKCASNCSILPRKNSIQLIYLKFLQKRWFGIITISVQINPFHPIEFSFYKQFSFLLQKKSISSDRPYNLQYSN